MGQDEKDPGAWYRPARVHLEDYDPRWPTMYEHEAALIRDAIGDDLVDIQHVGSTAVPGMPAKPIIDILASVSTWDRFEAIVERLAAIGYVYTPESESDDPTRKVFRKGPSDMASIRTHHLHVTEPASGYWQRIVGFRDQLRDDPSDADDYVRLKRELVAAFRNDSRSYTRGKQEFVRRIERKRGVGV